MKVLHVSAGNLYGGVERTLATLAREAECVPELERHFALCFGGRLSREMEVMQAPCALLGAVRVRYPWQIFRGRRRLKTLLQAGHWNAVICHMPWNYALFGPVARSLGLPVVLWMHDAAEGRHWIERWAARHPPDLVVCNSQFTASTLPKLFPGPKVPSHVVIHPPLATEASALDASAIAALRAELDTPADTCVIVQVSRLEPYKGHLLHLDALARLADVPGWMCWIVGGVQRAHEREYLARLRARAEENGIAERMRFLGERNDVRRLLAAADIFCQPNVRGEPFGMVFVEAMQACLPVVATAIGGALEIVDTTCGQLVPPGDADALAKALRGLIVDPDARARLGRTGPARAQQLSAPRLVLSQLYKALSQNFAGLNVSLSAHIPR